MGWPVGRGVRALLAAKRDDAVEAMTTRSHEVYRSEKLARLDKALAETRVRASHPIVWELKLDRVSMLISDDPARARRLLPELDRMPDFGDHRRRARNLRLGLAFAVRDHTLVPAQDVLYEWVVDAMRRGDREVFIALAWALRCRGDAALAAHVFGSLTLPYRGPHAQVVIDSLADEFATAIAETSDLVAYPVATPASVTEAIQANAEQEAQGFRARRMHQYLATTALASIAGIALTFLGSPVAAAALLTLGTVLGFLRTAEYYRTGVALAQHLRFLGRYREARVVLRELERVYRRDRMPLQLQRTWVCVDREAGDRDAGLERLDRVLARTRPRDQRDVHYWYLVRDRIRVLATIDPERARRHLPELDDDPDRISAQHVRVWFAYATRDPSALPDDDTLHAWVKDAIHDFSMPTHLMFLAWGLQHRGQPELARHLVDTVSDLVADVAPSDPTRSQRTAELAASILATPGGPPRPATRGEL